MNFKIMSLAIILALSSNLVAADYIFAILNQSGVECDVVVHMPGIGTKRTFNNIKPGEQKAIVTQNCLNSVEARASDSKSYTKTEFFDLCLDRVIEITSDFKARIR